MARRRQTGSGNWTRGAFAAFWILLGCVSGLYLFNVVTDPTLGGQLVKLSPAPSGETGGQGSQPQDLAAIQESLRELSQQVAALSGRLEGSETSDAPAPTAPPAAAETSAPSPTPAEPTADPVPPPQVEEPKPVQAEAPKPPEPEVKPMEQAALDATQSPAAAPEPPAPPKPYEPPPVAVSPLDELPAELEARTINQPEAAPVPEAEATPSSEAAALPEPPGATGSPSDTVPASPGPPGSEAAGAVASPAPPEPAASPTSPEPAASPIPPPETETAALDPIALPPAANDGSTRYGIEIGSVAKQDGLRPLWREYLTNHAALVAGLQPRRVLAPDKKWRLIAGPFTSAEEASQACALFKKASRPCEATVYAGDSL
jgi:hypothetical protein